ncbi:MAG TPA: hypothetical protein VE907_14820 [Gammaproteobacteria bacterium]|nr:hypothetical protein [Gammaproteobacteria bacterium]
MSDRSLLIAAFIVGGAIVAASFSTRARYSLSAAGNNVAWRMDTWSGQIDICAAAYLPTGPLVRCGAVVVTPDLGPQGAPATPSAPTPQSPSEQAPAQPFAPLPDRPRDHVSFPRDLAPVQRDDAPI